MESQSTTHRKEDFLKRSSLAVHQICFALGFIVALGILLTNEPGYATVAGIAAFILINMLGIAFRYAVSGNIQFFPRLSLASYYSSDSKHKARTPTPTKAREPLTGEGVTGYWDTKVDTKAY